jgi:hypothetical protein
MEMARGSNAPSPIQSSALDAASILSAMRDCRTFRFCSSTNDETCWRFAMKRPEMELLVVCVFILNYSPELPTIHGGRDKVGSPPMLR